MIGSRRVALALVVALAGSGCLPVHATPPAEPAASAASEWAVAYQQVNMASRDGRLSSADSMLTAFAQRFPGTPEAAEVPYWRAILHLDPASPAALHDALAALDGYLANAPNGQHRIEAVTLRRLVVAMEQRNAALAAVPPAPAARPDDKAREEEMQRLRDDLAKANAELDRIRRRLARPRP